MKRPAIILPIGLVLLFGACASTPPADSGPAKVPAMAVAAPAAQLSETARLDPDETICRRQVKTGSRFAETRCQTRHQWELEQREARKQTEEQQGVVGPPQT